MTRGKEREVDGVRKEKERLTAAADPKPNRSSTAAGTGLPKRSSQERRKEVRNRMPGPEKELEVNDQADMKRYNMTPPQRIVPS
jgi:hypothetical protein